MNDYHLAQINIARMLAPIDGPIMADFVAQLPPINARICLQKRSSLSLTRAEVLVRKI